MARTTSAVKQTSLEERSGIRAVKPRFAAGTRQRLIHALVLVALLSVMKFGLGMRLLAPILAGPSRADAFSANLGSWATVLAVTLLTVAGNIGALLCAYGRVSIAELGWRRSRPGLTLLFGLVTFVLCATLAVFHTSIATDLPAQQILGWTLEYSPTQRMLFLLIGLQSAFTVESLFRGYLQPELSSRFGPVMAVLLTSVAFGIYHVDFRPLAFLNSFLTSCVLGWMRERSQGTLTEAAIGHALYWTAVGPI